MLLWMFTVRYAVEASTNEDSPPTKLTAKGAINLKAIDRPTRYRLAGRNSQQQQQQQQQQQE
jgi:hypothetical protein